MSSIRDRLADILLKLTTFEAALDAIGQRIQNADNGLDAIDQRILTIDAELVVIEDELNAPGPAIEAILVPGDPVLKKN